MDLGNLLIAAPVLLFSMVAHEYAHGWAALRQGDPTAYQLGRLTLNPLKHIDPFMTIILPVMTALWGGFIFGGAKPVPVNPRNYRNYKRGDIIVSLAGIATNLVLAAVCTLLAFAIGQLARAIPSAVPTLAILQHMMIAGVLFNLILAFFNLLPIPPLDGSHVMKYLLPPAWSLRYQALGRYGLLVLIALLALAPKLLTTWMKPASALFETAMALLLPNILPPVWRL